MAVYDYAERIDTPGFGFMDTPGYDPISMTGLVSGGCNVGVFTTGRGACMAANRLPVSKWPRTRRSTIGWRGYGSQCRHDYGRDGNDSGSGDATFEKIISVANGEKTKSELNGIGDEEFQPWFPGPQY